MNKPHISLQNGAWWCISSLRRRGCGNSPEESFDDYVSRCIACKLEDDLDSYIKQQRVNYMLRSPDLGERISTAIKKGA